MTATAVASSTCIPDQVFCAWSGYKNKLNCLVLFCLLFSFCSIERQKIKPGSLNMHIQNRSKDPNDQCIQPLWQKRFSILLHFICCCAHGLQFLRSNQLWLIYRNVSNIASNMLLFSWMHVHPQLFRWDNVSYTAMNLLAGFDKADWFSDSI